MNQALVDRIANAVLYEGYLLYPYRPSVKNRQRWTFGGLYPQSYSLAQQGSEPCSCQTECLVRAGSGARLSGRLRFLHLLERRNVESGGPAGAVNSPAWQEAVEREVALGECDLTSLAATSQTMDFAFPPHHEEDPWIDATGTDRGLVIREQVAVAGCVEMFARPVTAEIARVTIRVLNLTPFVDAEEKSRDEALLRALVATHLILSVRDGEFLSLIDPPDSCREAAAACRNVGSWPVLVGDPGETDTILSAPIILYDYPQIAPESPGDLFDATEIDEILTLRILTLTDEEKQAVASVDERGRLLLERTEALAREQLMQLHGTVRGLRPC